MPRERPWGPEGGFRARGYPPGVRFARFSWCRGAFLVLSDGRGGFAGGAGVRSSRYASGIRCQEGLKRHTGYTPIARQGRSKGPRPDSSARLFLGGSGPLAGRLADRPVEEGIHGRGHLVGEGAVGVGDHGSRAVVVLAEHVVRALDVHALRARAPA